MVKRQIEISDPNSKIVNASVIIPNGVLETSSTITIGEFTEDLPPMPIGIEGLGTPIHFGPDGLDFIPHSVTLAIPYSEEDLIDHQINDPMDLHIYTFHPSTNQWELVGTPMAVDSVNLLVMVEVTHFSLFRLGITATDLTTDPSENSPSGSGCFLRLLE